MQEVGLNQLHAGTALCVETLGQGKRFFTGAVVVQHDVVALQVQAFAQRRADARGRSRDEGNRCSGA